MEFHTCDLTVSFFPFIIASLPALVCVHTNTNRETFTYFGSLVSASHGNKENFKKSVKAGVLIQAD